HGRGRRGRAPRRAGRALRRTARPPQPRRVVPSLDWARLSTRAGCCRLSRAGGAAMTTAIRIGRALLWLVYAWVVVTVVLLFLAFLLQLFGANPTAGFV